MAQSTLDVAPVLSLQATLNGQRSTLFQVNANRGSDLHLTAGGEVLFLTENTVDRSGTSAETRLRLVHPRGFESMSCRLMDETIFGGGSENPVGPLQLGAETGFNGRWLAVRTLPIDCPVCDGDLWAPPRLAFYDLGPPALGVSARGWVAPRGSPAGQQRVR